APGYFEFYQHLIENPPPGGRAHVASLRVDDFVVATNWGMIFNGRFYDLLGGYEDGEWARLSVARLLVESIVEWCIADPAVAIYDLTVGAEAYKAHWSDHSLAIYEYLAPRNIAGSLYVGYRAWRSRLKQNDK